MSTLWVIKHATLHSFITLANVGQFQNFFHCWNQQEICNMIQHFPLHLKHVVLLHWKIHNIKNSKILVYLTHQHQFPSTFHKINKQKYWRWMLRNELNAKSVFQLHKYIHRDIYTTHQRHRWCFTSSHDMYQAYINSFFGHCKKLSGILTDTFWIKYCSLPGSDLDCYGHVTLIFTLSGESHYLSKLYLPHLKLS